MIKTKKTSFAYFIILVSLMLSPVFSRADNDPSPAPRRDFIRDVIQEQKNKVQGERGRQAEEMKSRREKAEALMKSKRQEFETRFNDKKAETEKRINDKREQLKERLTAVRDENKKRIVERVDRQVDALNARLLNHFSELLNRLEDVLARIGNRADELENNGADVSSIREAISRAENVINLARSAIEEQTGKTYEILVTDEATLKNAVQRIKQAAHNDLSEVRNLVKSAFEAVKNAANKLKEINNSPSE